MPKGQIPWNKGKTGVYSEETLQKKRDAGLSYKPSEESKEKSRQWHLINKEKSFETLKKATEAARLVNTGRSLSAETKIKLSISHKGKKHTDESKKKMSKAKIGKDSPKWKGGRVFDVNGYVVIQQRHHFSERKLEHRIIMEKLIGRSLFKEEVVHHINKNPSDNRPENLILFNNQAEHVKYHKKQRDILKETTNGR